ncbi:uncharacterized protein NPIL_12251 [Nephila pilipes]|uniref:Uncharacterized protein n=1 Tax=Nephila pilipes TaxID=299642 RepID=A0A8X6TVL0_NEPPI|nr:uncharacterized protein NPIL_12251 [Nephila pilipes]
MSVQKLMFVTAVPFGLSRFQNSVNRTFTSMTGGVGISENNDFRILPRFRTAARNTSNAHLRMIKKRSKIFHNRIPVRVSKEKIKLQKDLIEQQLLDLKVEKTKLYLENEDLKIRCSSLEEENQCLRLQLQKPQSSEGLGSSTDIHSPDDNSGRVDQQCSIKTNDSFSLSGSFPNPQSVDKIDDSSSRNYETDVFVVSLSEDIMMQPVDMDTNAVARTISREEIISCEETNDSTKNTNIDEVDHINFPEPWTFDNLYEDLDNEISFYI